MKFVKLYFAIIFWGVFGCSGTPPTPTTFNTPNTNQQNTQPNVQSQKIVELEHMPEEISKAWIKATANPLWFDMEDTKKPYVKQLAAGKSGDLPVYQLIRVPLATLKTLPAPQMPFGLILQSIDTTDADIKELKRFENLVYLEFHFSMKVTCEGIKALGDMKNLKLINLGAYNDMPVTGEFLSILQKNKQLHLTTMAVGKDGKRPATPEDVVEFRWTPNVKLTESIFQTLKSYPNLATFSCFGLKLDDKSIEGIEGFDNVKSWDLSGTKITDDGVRAVLARPNIESLNLGRLAVTDGILADIAKIKTLKALDLNTTAITDKGLAELSKSTSIESLNLNASQQISDVGIRHLSAMKQMKILQLDFTKLTDDGVNGIVKLTQLEHLSMNNTAITDASVPQFAQLKNLKTLSLVLTQKTTKAEVLKLNTTLPNCKVFWGVPSY